jgi:hypothetical protein
MTEKKFMVIRKEKTLVKRREGDPYIFLTSSHYRKP